MSGWWNANKFLLVLPSNILERAAAYDEASKKMYCVVATTVFIFELAALTIDYRQQRVLIFFPLASYQRAHSKFRVSVMMTTSAAIVVGLEVGTMNSSSTLQLVIYIYRVVR